MPGRPTRRRPICVCLFGSEITWDNYRGGGEGTHEEGIGECCYSEKQRQLQREWGGVTGIRTRELRKEGKITFN